LSKSTNKWLAIAIAALAVAIALVFALLFFFRPTIVPDVTLKPVDEATTLIVQAGLTLGTTSEVATGSVGEGRVMRQSPSAAARAPRKSSVDITVAVAPKSLKVPDVVGQDASSAEKTLAGALFLPRRVDVFGATGTVGAVAAQVPVADTSWFTGRPVAFAVSAGPNDGTGVKVPDLMGKSIAAAFAELEKVGLVPFEFVTQITTPADNVVVRQLPEGGLYVRPGTTVLLLFEAP
jgi:eukaryotic-like serine/threonine-protein kinase